MAFPWLLQRYIFREMAGTFLLSAAALTGVLSLGGGVLNMFKLGEVTPGQFLRLMFLVVPVAIALTLPVAALFSAASTYGRLSADNEFVACRSSGINLHILLLPTLLLSLFSASITFLCSNFVIPGMVRNLNEFVSANIGAQVAQRLKRPGGITLAGRYRISADEVHMSPDDPQHIVLGGVCFAEIDNEQWVRFGTAGGVDLRIDTERSVIDGSMFGLSVFDRKSGRFADLEEQPINPTPLPSIVPMKVKFLTLGALLELWQSPGEWHTVAAAMETLRVTVAQKMVYDALLEGWKKDRRIRLGDPRRGYTIASEQAGRIPRLGGIELTDVTIDETRDGATQSFRVGRVLIEVLGADRLEEASLRIDVPSSPIPRVQSVPGPQLTRSSLTPMPLPETVLADAQALSHDDLLARSKDAAEHDPQGEARKEAVDRWDDTRRAAIGSIHERFALSASALVLVILGATLGIIFRGSHVMTAFGISFVPSVLVVVAIVTGKQMSYNGTTHFLGLLVMWGGIVAVAGIDLWAITQKLRR